MQAKAGDRLYVHSHIVGEVSRQGKIIKVQGENGEPPFVVQYDDGHEALVFPGPDAVVEPAKAGR